MSYKDDLKKFNAWLNNRETGRMKSTSNTHDRRERNKRSRVVAACVRRWRNRWGVRGDAQGLRQVSV
jgi:hypothetical protein